MAGKGGDTTSSTLDVKEEEEGRMRCERYERGEESEGGNKTWNGNSTEHSYPSFHSPCPSAILPNPTASLHLPPITKLQPFCRPFTFYHRPPDWKLSNSSSQPSQAGHSEVMGSHTHLLHLPLPPSFPPRYIFLRRSRLSYRKAHSQRLQM